MTTALMTTVFRERVRGTGSMETVTSFNRLELLQVADVVAREKAIDRDVVLMAMEDAIQKAARSRYGLENDIHAEIDRKSGEIRLERHLQVVDKIENDAIEIGGIEAQRRNPNETGRETWR